MTCASPSRNLGTQSGHCPPCHAGVREAARAIIRSRPESGNGGAGVSFEDRQDLLGHRSTRVTTDYSAAELRNLLDAANRVQKSPRADSGLASSGSLRGELQAECAHDLKHSAEPRIRPALAICRID